MSTRPQIRIPMPSPELLQVIGSTPDLHEEEGKRWVTFLVSLCALKPGQRILDIGCGVGRTARALTGYLSDEGEYEGFDVSKEAIEWCRQEITSRYSNFHFDVVDISNTAYNPTGGQSASAYRFPYPAEHFDVIVLQSLFTHMLPEGMENYLSECQRVLKESGSCLISYFIVNEEVDLTADNLIEKFGRDKGGYRVVSEEMPEATVGYEEAFLRGAYARLGFAIEPPIRYGAWREGVNSPPLHVLGEKLLSYQDMVVVSKRRR
jgi:ubiquinone/menaquinone biosynthesis C-methylase UbiE